MLHVVGLFLFFSFSSFFFFSFFLSFFIVYIRDICDRIMRGWEGLVSWDIVVLATKVVTAVGVRSCDVSLRYT